MTIDSPEELEPDVRKVFEAERDRARQATSVADDPLLRERASQFLADYEHIWALSGMAFLEAAVEAMDRLDNKSDAEYEADLEEHAQELRQLFEDQYGLCVQLLEAQDGFYSSIARRGEARELSPMGKRFREHATLLLTNADRIRALPRDEFIIEAEAALKPFLNIDMNTVKAEIYGDWASTPLLRRWQVKLRERFARSRTS